LGQKVNPIGFRLGVNKDWQSRWYADKHYTELLQEDLHIRNVIATKYKDDDIAKVEIERASNQVTVTVHTSRPGIVIGRGGQRVDETRTLLEGIAGKRVRLNIQEVAQPELDACLVARSIAQQIERRISHRRAMKQAIFRAMERGAQGAKICCAGRLGNSEYARKETLHEGRVPLHTIRADIDYATSTARTTLGAIGIKVWIYKGDIIPEYEKFTGEVKVTPVGGEQPKPVVTVEKPVVSADVNAAAAAGDTPVVAEVKEPASAVEQPKAAMEDASKGRLKDRVKVKVADDKPKTEEAASGEKPKSRVRFKAKPKTEMSSDDGAAGVKETKVEAGESNVEEKAKTKAKSKPVKDSKPETE
jgi:small subunit ribosomal protein S3